MQPKKAAHLTSKTLVWLDLTFFQPRKQLKHYLDKTDDGRGSDFKMVGGEGRGGEGRRVE